MTLVLTETTKLKLEVQGGPDFSQYMQDYVFDFSNINGEWFMIKVTEVPIGSSTS